MTSMREDPWSTLDIPNANHGISAKRVDEAGVFDFFWGLDIEGRVLLGLAHPGAPIPPRQLPRPQGLKLSDDPVADDRALLCIRLVAPEQRDIFLALCHDVVQAASSASDDREALAIALARTWRWHHLLRGGSSGLLSREEQKGLIGELSFFSGHLSRSLATVDLVRSWRGPLGAPKDFEIGSLCVEVKARRGAAAPYLSISSEDQLDSSGLSDLFLFVIDLHSSVEGEGGRTLTEYAEEARTIVEQGDPAAVLEFEGLLMAAGFRWSDDYSDARWTVDATRLFRVEAGFPRIAGGSLGAGVSRVRYQVQLAECKPFECATEAVDSAIQGMGRVDEI